MWLRVWAITWGVPTGVVDSLSELIGSGCPSARCVHHSGSSIKSFDVRIANALSAFYRVIRLAYSRYFDGPAPLDHTTSHERSYHLGSVQVSSFKLSSSSCNPSHPDGDQFRAATYVPNGQAPCNSHLDSRASHSLRTVSMADHMACVVPRVPPAYPLLATY